MAKTTIENPDSQEREYTRELRALVREMQSEVDAQVLPEVKRLEEAFKNTEQEQSFDEIDAILAAILAGMLLRAQSLRPRALRIFEAVSRFHEGQFSRLVKAQTGFDVPRLMPGAPLSSILGASVFRSEPFIRPILDAWITENVALIESIPRDAHDKLSRIIKRGILNGDSFADISKEIQKTFAVTKSRAQLIAEDQVLKLNADLTKYRLQSVGVNEYIWRTRGDDRVRPSHAERNGKQYSWDKPPANGGHPGQEIRCRCRAQPIFPKSE